MSSLGKKHFFSSISSSVLPGLQNSLHGRVSISGSWFSRRPSRRVLCLVSSPKGSPRLQSAEHLDHSDQSPMSPEKINEITLQTIGFEIGYHPLLIFRSSSFQLCRKMWQPHLCRGQMAHTVLSSKPRSTNHRDFHRSILEAGRSEWECRIFALGSSGGFHRRRCSTGPCHRETLSSLQTERALVI